MLLSFVPPDQFNEPVQSGDEALGSGCVKLSATAMPVCLCYTSSERCLQAGYFCIAGPTLAWNAALWSLCI